MITLSLASEVKCGQMLPTHIITLLRMARRNNNNKTIIYYLMVNMLTCRILPHTSAQSCTTRIRPKLQHMNRRSAVSPHAHDEKQRATSQCSHTKGDGSNTRRSEFTRSRPPCPAWRLLPGAPTAGLLRRPGSNRRPRTTAPPRMARQTCPSEPGRPALPTHRAPPAALRRDR